MLGCFPPGKNILPQSFKMNSIGSRVDKEEATAKNVLLYGLFRCGFRYARINSFASSLLTLLVLPLVLTAGARGSDAQLSPEAAVGKRLFFETRFAQAFLVQSNGNVNATAISGDPVLEQTQTAGSPLPGPFAGKTMNCRNCHLEDEQAGAPGGGIRTYAGFARRSPVPAREDGKLSALRNAPSLAGATASRTNFFLHFDGEFASGAGLVQGTFTGRNFGWLPGEQAAAMKHIATVIRGDDGTGDLAKQSGGAYAKVFAGDPSVPAAFQLTRKFRLDVSHATDAKILAAAGSLVEAFLKSIRFSTDAAGAFNGSPYDLFLIRNNLPRAPNPRESRLAYSHRLRAAVNALSNPVFVGPSDGQFATHAIAYVFGADELAGMKLFFTEAPAQPPPAGAPPMGGGVGGAGNCIGCHTAPGFTDFLFHNIGVSQLEYDALQGNGAFMNLKIPSLAERKANPSAALPPNAKHPSYMGPFASIPSLSNPSQVDLGLWNVFGNPDIPKPQNGLKKVAREALGHLKDDETLARTIATFKTPGLRDLQDSQPYFHNGSIDDLTGAVNFYVLVSQLARANQIRNADPRLAGIALMPSEAAQVVKFLNALTEDFKN